MRDPMIDLEFHQVCKVYRIRQESHKAPQRGPWGDLGRRLFSRMTEFVAVDNVSFEVPSGQTLGIIGHNGAGKSTILRLLSNVTTPTSGEIRIRGRIASLLEVGSGFHPELTGRENAYLSGSILGMRRAEITKKLDSIVDFAEVRPFIDVPVKRYSAGMYVRLGFSIAAHLEPDILLLDEVLAVGDMAFQERCLNRIEELRRAGITIVFISHDLIAVQRLCERVLLLKRGRVVYDGAAKDAIGAYMESGRFQYSTRNVTHNSIPGRITDLKLLDGNGCPCTTFRTGAELCIRVGLVVEAPMTAAVVSVSFLDPMRKVLFELTTADHEMTLAPGACAIEFHCPEFPLQPGVYKVDVVLEEVESFRDPDWQRECACISVDRGKPVRGIVYAPHSWRLVQ